MSQALSPNTVRRLAFIRFLDNFDGYGSIPSATDLDQFRGEVTTFFTDATRAVLTADFTSIDMTGLVTQQEALSKIRDAETRASQGDYVEALALLSEALDNMLDDYANRKRTSHDTTAFSFGPEHAFDEFAAQNFAKIDPKLGNHILAMTEATRSASPRRTSTSTSKACGANSKRSRGRLRRTAGCRGQPIRASRCV